LFCGQIVKEEQWPERIFAFSIRTDCSEKFAKDFFVKRREARQRGRCYALFNWQLRDKRRHPPKPFKSALAPDRIAADLAADAAKESVPSVEGLKLKDPKDFRYLGKGEVSIVDLRNITVGAAHYGADTRLPGMKYAVIARPPVTGGKLVSFDASEAMKNQLRVLRAERQWSQGDLAEKLGVSRQTVNAIETEKYDPSLPLAFKLAKLFRKPIEEVFRP